MQGVADVTVVQALPDQAEQLDVGVVDYTGAIAEGRLMRGANQILMTFELIVAEG